MTFRLLLALFTVVGLLGLVGLAWWSYRAARESPVRSPGDGSVGTLRWIATSGGGELDRLGRLELWAMASPLLLTAPVELASRIRPRKKRLPYGVRGPTTPFASDVLAECEAMGVDWLVDHCKRTYAFAVLRSRQTGYRVDDDELLWAACLLHDVGLVDANPEEPGSPPCFTNRSALVAERLARQHGWGDERTDRLCEAITLHVNPRVSRARGIEAWLLRFASGLDITGIGFGKLYSDAMDRTVDRFPIGEQKEAVLRLWDDEAARQPACRAAVLKRMGFKPLVKTSPMYRKYA